MRLCGLMDKAPDFGSGDCRFESCHGRNIFLSFAEILIGLCSQEKRIMNYYNAFDSTLFSQKKRR